MGNTLVEFRTLKSSSEFAGASQITLEFSRVLPKRLKNVLVVSAQNATPVEPEWWQCILAAAAHYHAEIFVIPLRYKNPTSVWSRSQANKEQWPDECKDFMWNKRIELHPHLKLFADVPTQPTDTQPLSGFDAMSGPQSVIYGHVKLASTIVPVPSGRMGKLMTTTGACTVENYGINKRGKIAEFHHSLSALLVELDGPRFHVRQLHYSKAHRSATDGLKGNTFHPNGAVTTAPRALAVACGDIHVDFIDPKVWRATERIIARVEPEAVILPDLLDSYAVNPHTRDDPFNQAAKHKSGRNNMHAETQRAIGWSRYNAKRWPDTEWVVQASNHNDMLRRFLARDFNWRTDHTNSEFGLETALAMVRAAKMTKHGASGLDPLHYWFRKEAALEANIRLLELDEPYMKADVALHLHGDLGANGAKGSRKTFAHMGDKSVTDHTHSDYIYEGNYGTGTSTYLKAEYNHGLSGWTNAHVLLQWDGKRQIVRFIDGHCHN